MTADRISLAAAGLVLLSLPWLAQAQKEKASAYPRVNLARTWVVDPSWPSRPPGVGWEAVSGLTVDGKDNIYVYTRATPPVQVYDASGKYLRGWGEKTIKMAHHIRIDPEGNVWITDIGNHTVEKYTPDGQLLLTLGTKGTAGRDEKHFNKPTDVAITRDGDIYVSDGYGNARVVHFDKTGRYRNEWGELGSAPGQFSIPHSIAVDSRNRVYVADRNNVRIQVFDADGKFLTQWKDLMVPWGLWMTRDDELWACGSSPMQWRPTDETLGCPPKDQVFLKFNPQGQMLQLFTLPKGADGLERPGEVNWVHCIAFDSGGNMYLGDIIGKRAQKFLLKMP